MSMYLVINVRFLIEVVIILFFAIDFYKRAAKIDLNKYLWFGLAYIAYFVPTYLIFPLIEPYFFNARSNSYAADYLGTVFLIVLGGLLLSNYVLRKTEKKRNQEQYIDDLV